MDSIHLKIEKIRIQKGVTKTHIAKKCGKSVSWYCGISSGRRKASVESLNQIADALEVDVRIFFESKLSDTLNKRRRPA